MLFPQHQGIEPHTCWSQHRHAIRIFSYQNYMPYLLVVQAQDRGPHYMPTCQFSIAYENLRIHSMYRLFETTIQDMLVRGHNAVDSNTQQTLHQAAQITLCIQCPQRLHSYRGWASWQMQWRWWRLPGWMPQCQRSCLCTATWQCSQLDYSWVIASLHPSHINMLGYFCVLPLSVRTDTSGSILSAVLNLMDGDSAFVAHSIHMFCEMFLNVPNPQAFRKAFSSTGVAQLCLVVQTSPVWVWNCWVKCQRVFHRPETRTLLVWNSPGLWLILQEAVFGTVDQFLIISDFCRVMYR